MALKIATQDCVESNADWAPYVGIEGVTERDFNGVTMVLVPCGCFMMGTSPEQAEYAINELGASSSWVEDEQVDGDAHEQCFDAPFWIDKTEVTNGQYGSSGNWSGDDLPRESIDWFDSLAYCEDRGARLPTEREWEYAARGPDNWIFPWGDDFDGTKVNFCDTNCTYDYADKNANDGFETTAPVGSYLSGVSWVGALDLSGNVWEWVSSLYEPYPYDESDGREDVNNRTDARAVRGGSWLYDDGNVRASYRGRLNPSSEDDNLGFRCVRSY
jgi:formylglycine-generating enzyme required for sulfatase activity